LLLRFVVSGYPGSAGAATGVTQTGVYAGAVLGPLSFGVLSERAGNDIAWWVVSGWLVLAAAVAAWLRYRPQRELAT